MTTNNDTKKSFDITIDSSLVLENTYDLKTRVPGTYGENVRYLWLKKDDVEFKNDGKTILTQLDAEKKYMLYDKFNKFVEDTKGDKLYKEHYDPVNRQYIKDFNESGKTSSEKAQSVSDENVNNHSSSEIDKDNNSRNIPEQKSDVISEDKYKINVPILSNLYDKCNAKVAELKDKNLKLSAKIEKFDNKINKLSRFVSLFETVKGSVPSPVSELISLIAKEKQEKITSLNCKIQRNESKINKNLIKINKNTDRAKLYVKINTFIENMKSADGRKENYITGLSEFQNISTKNTAEKLNKNLVKIENTINEYNKTHYATEKIKLKKKLLKLSNKKDVLQNRLMSLDNLKIKINNLSNVSDNRMNQVIDNSYENIIADLSNNPESVNQVETVVNACSKAIDDNLSQNQEKDNYLKMQKCLLKTIMTALTELSTTVINNRNMIKQVKLKQNIVIISFLLHYQEDNSRKRSKDCAGRTPKTI